MLLVVGFCLLACLLLVVVNCFFVVDDVLVVVAAYITEVVGLSKPLASMVRGTWCKQPPASWHSLRPRVG